jgi:hypothetical protein
MEDPTQLNPGINPWLENQISETEGKDMIRAGIE